MTLRSKAPASLFAAAGFIAVAGGFRLGAFVLMVLGLVLVALAAAIAPIVFLRRASAASSTDEHPPAESAEAVAPSAEPVTEEPPVEAPLRVEPEPPESAGPEVAAPEGPAPEAAAPELPSAEPTTCADTGLLRPVRLPEPAGPESADVLDAFLRALAPVGEVFSAHLWLFDETTRTLRLAEDVGQLSPPAEPVRVDSSILGQAATSGRALLSPDVRLHEGGEHRQLWRFALPLRAGETTGVAAADIAAQSPDRSILIEVAAHFRSHLAASLSLHVSKEEATEARELVKATGDIVGAGDEEAVVEAALRWAVELTGADVGSVMLVDPDDERMRIKAARGLPEDVVAATSVEEGEGIAGVVLATGKPLVVEDLEDKGPRARRHGVRSAMAAPIADARGKLGVINVGSRSFPPRDSAAKMEALESLGRVVAASLRKADSLADSREGYLDAVKALALALEGKDPYSRGSTERVFELAGRLGSAMGLSPAELHALRVAALFHDLGMVAAGDVPALGNRPLTTVEHGMLKMHPVIAAEILRRVPALKDAVPIVYHHHEHYDGSGYVLGLAGDQIPLAARVLSVADAYVSMTSPRPYRAARSHEGALGELRRHAGTQFDPTVVEALLEVAERSPESFRAV